MSVVDLVFGFAVFPLAVVASYLGFLAVMARARPPPPEREPRWRMDVIVPAHDEEAGIAATVESLKAVDYPASLRRVLVVADNCTDQTAERARAAGADVLVRTDAERRGKGYALELAFARSREEGRADAVVVVDADTVVSPNLLRAFARRLDAGEEAVQASYGVRNPRDSWRTRLMTLALALFNDLRSLGRERMRWSAGLRGNGMCFTHTLLMKVPHQAYSLVEDLEFGIRLGRARVRVAYAAEAQVKGEMVTTEKASRSQRRRWEGGRWLLARQQALPILREAIAKRSGMLLDLGLDLIVPPLSWVVLAAGALTGAGLIRWGSLGVAPPWLSVVMASDVALLLYVLRGWALSGVGWRGLLDLLWAPVFIVWKLLLVLSPREHRREEWVRTTREKERETHGS